MKDFLRKMRVSAFAVPALAVPSLGLTAFASSGSTAVTAADWSTVISAVTDQISVSTVVGVLATLVAAGIGLVFMWWGVRKALRSLMSAFRSGKMKL